MSGRKYNSGSSYRFGFNGKENDREYGSQLVQDYGFRVYNPCIGRFLSEDPLTKDYPMLTPYQFASNTPIQAIDLDGLEACFINFDTRLSYVIGTINVSITLAMDTEGNIGILITPSAGLGVGWGASAGISWGINNTINGIEGLQGWGGNLGGFAGAGTGLNYAMESNFAFPTLDEDNNMQTVEGLDRGSGDDVSTGFTISVLPNGTPLPGAAFGIGVYGDVGYTIMLGQTNVVDAFNDVNEALGNAGFSLEGDFGIEEEDFGFIMAILQNQVDQMVSTEQQEP